MINKNERYTSSKKAQAEKIKELEFRNFELERTLESVFQLIKLGLKKHHEPNHGGVQEEAYRSVEENTNETKNFKPIASQTQDWGSPQLETDIIPEVKAKRVKKTTITQTEELTPEQKEIERKRRMSSPLNGMDMEDIKQQVLKNTVAHSQAQRELDEEQQASYSECSVCGERNDKVGFSEKLQKHYCLSCLQKASFKF